MEKEVSLSLLRIADLFSTFIQQRGSTMLTWVS